MLAKQRLTAKRIYDHLVYEYGLPEKIDHSSVDAKAEGKATGSYALLEFLPGAFA
ncbi:hypothetical protein [Paenibacillus polymyxa]|uniref:hypothetical protein n=1 Tax=Paenibacillus polymyxa TaxID=1406 RepID=UPI00129A9A80|nr:hypothetical protein [Paenibacillus polymyxa]MCJ1221143.1 hypothetical protein [Paenibacillus polymyxa]